MCTDWRWSVWTKIERPEPRNSTLSRDAYPSESSTSHVVPQREDIRAAQGEKLRSREMFWTLPVNNDDLLIEPGTDQTVRVKVNKQTHEVRFDNETEDEVTVTIKPRN